MRTIKITVSRTVQVERFEPSMVTVEETIQIKDDEDPTEHRKKLYADVTKQVKRYIDNERLKYGSKEKED